MSIALCMHILCLSQTDNIPLPRTLYSNPLIIGSKLTAYYSVHFGDICYTRITIGVLEHTHCVLCFICAYTQPKAVPAARSNEMSKLADVRASERARSKQDSCGSLTGRTRSRSHIRQPTRSIRAFVSNSANRPTASQHAVESIFVPSSIRTDQ